MKTTVTLTVDSLLKEIFCLFIFLVLLIQRVLIDSRMVKLLLIVKVTVNFLFLF